MTSRAIARPEEAWCPRCRMWQRFGQPRGLEFLTIELSRDARTKLLAAAKEFDEEAERMTPNESYTAVDFLDWLLGSLHEVG